MTSAAINEAIRFYPRALQLGVRVLINNNTSGLTPSVAACDVIVMSVTNVGYYSSAPLYIRLQFTYLHIRGR